MKSIGALSIDSKKLVAMDGSDNVYLTDNTYVFFVSI